MSESTTWRTNHEISDDRGACQSRAHTHTCRSRGVVVDDLGGATSAVTTHNDMGVTLDPEADLFITLDIRTFKLAFFRHRMPLCSVSEPVGTTHRDARAERLELTFTRYGFIVVNTMPWDSYKPITPYINLLPCIILFLIISNR